ncbi:DUF4097 family beta strand repeat-containing protein [Alkaliphilus serpentinus]|nr:DUF4097 family beta strand repeat-containing protein [Alkaliphilus serpentinus]
MNYNATGGIKTYSLPFPIHHRGISNVFDQPEIQTHHYIIDDAEVHSIENIKNIDLQCKGTIVRLIPTTEGDIKIHLYGKISSSEAYITPSLLTAVEDGFLYGEIKHYESPLLHIESDLCLDISIPREYKEDIEIENSYGNLMVDEIQHIKSFSFKTITGSIDIQRLLSKETKLETVTGNIQLQQVESNLNIETVTGAVAIEVANSEKVLSIKTTTGNCDIILSKNSNVNPSFKTVTGRINTKYNEGDSSINLETITGAFNITYK